MKNEPDHVYVAIAVERERRELKRDQENIPPVSPTVHEDADKKKFKSPQITNLFISKKKSLSKL